MAIASLGNEITELKRPPENTIFLEEKKVGVNNHIKKRWLCKEHMDFITSWEAMQSKEGVQKKTTNSINDCEKHDHKGGRTLIDVACKEVIDTYMDNFDNLPTEEDPTISEETQFEKENENVSESGDEVKILMIWLTYGKKWIQL